MSNRCKAKTNAGARCKKGAGDNGLCWTHRKRKPYKFDAIKRGEYIELLDRGVGRSAAAAAVGVHRSTVAVYRNKHEDFTELESMAEMNAVADVEDALYSHALEGNVTATIFFLKNRAPHRWKDMKTVEVLDKLRAVERDSLFRALDAAGLSDDQFKAFERAYEGGDAGTVH